MKVKVKVIVDSQEIRTKEGNIIHKTHVITSDNDVVPLISNYPVKAGDLLEVQHTPKIFFVKRG